MRVRKFFIFKYVETSDSALFQICAAAREQGGQEFLLTSPFSEITKDLSNVTSGKSFLLKIDYQELALLSTLVLPYVFPPTKSQAKKTTSIIFTAR